MYATDGRIWLYNHFRHNHGKYDNSWKGWSMIIRWVTNTSFRLPKHGYMSWTHKTAYIAKNINKVTETKEVATCLTHSRQNIPDTQLSTPLDLSLYKINAYEQSYIVVMMRRSNRAAKENDLQAIIFPAYGTHHRLHSINGHKTQLTRYPYEKQR